eukprot:scaffold55253_cov23-Tisochrysis_lutea.AAC.2
MFCPAALNPTLLKHFIPSLIFYACPAQLPPELDVYALLAGPAALNPSPLDDGPALRAWWVNLPRGRHALRSCAERRLAAKVGQHDVFICITTKGGQLAVWALCAAQLREAAACSWGRPA